MVKKPKNTLIKILNIFKKSGSVIIVILFIIGYILLKKYYKKILKQAKNEHTGKKDK